MNISGISALRYLLQNQGVSSSQNTLTDVLLNAAANRSSLSTLPVQGESFHMEIELTDGTKVTIDYARQGVLNKTSYELGHRSPPRRVAEGLSFSRFEIGAFTACGLTPAGALACAGCDSGICDAEALSRLRRTTGSFVRVPGGWKDF